MLETRTIVGDLHVDPDSCWEEARVNGRRREFKRIEGGWNGVSVWISACRVFRTKDEACSRITTHNTISIVAALAEARRPRKEIAVCVDVAKICFASACVLLQLKGAVTLGGDAEVFAVAGPPCFTGPEDTKESGNEERPLRDELILILLAASLKEENAKRVVKHVKISMVITSS